jgi:hypothetical protein
MSSQTRREFTRLGLVALPALGLLPLSRLSAAEPSASKPNSKVQIGLNVPYSFASPIMSGAEILKNCVALGLSGVELRTQPVEAFLGLAPELAAGKKDGEKTTAASRADDLRAFRKGASMEKATEFRTMYETAGVLTRS